MKCGIVGYGEYRLDCYSRLEMVCQDFGSHIYGSFKGNDWSEQFECFRSANEVIMAK